MELLSLGIVAVLAAMIVYDRVVDRKTKNTMYKNAKVYDLPSNTYTPQQPSTDNRKAHKHDTPYADAADRRFEAFMDENDEEDFTGEDWLTRYMATEDES